MRSLLARLPTVARLLLALPILAIAYPVVVVVIPAAIHAAVPEVVRSVLRLI
jgi:hypothetical protein